MFLGDSYAIVSTSDKKYVYDPSNNTILWTATGLDKVNK